MKKLSAAALFFVSIIFLCTAGPPAKSAVNKPLPASVSNEAIHIKTRWLANGLRVVEVTGPWASDIVSIRLIVRGGSLGSPGNDKLGFHLLEHLVFNRAPDGFEQSGSRISRCGSMNASVNADYQEHEYDIHRNCAEVVLVMIASEWDRRSFDADAVEVERRRVRAELTNWDTNNPLGLLGSEIRPCGALSYRDEAELAFVDTVSAGKLRRIFDERYVAGNISLILAGNRDVVESLGPCIERFGKVPPSGVGDGARAGDLGWLAGDLKTCHLRSVHSFGLHFEDPGDFPSPVRSIIRNAVGECITNDLSGGEFSIELGESTVCFMPDREIWAWQIQYGGSQIDQAFEEITKKLEWLGSDDARPWWRRHAQRQYMWRAISTAGPVGVINSITADLARSPQSQPASDWELYVEPPDVDEVIDAYRAIYARATIFRTHYDRTRSALRCNDGNPKPAGFLDFLLLERDGSGAWWMIALLTGLVTVVVGTRTGARLGAAAIVRWRQNLLRGPEKRTDR